MRPRDSSVSLLALVALMAGSGCGSSTQPIPDPGGPFHTSVSANKSLGALTTGETSELCNDLDAADGTFLLGAASIQETCLMFGYAAASLVDAGTSPVDGGANSADGGNDYQRACQSEYDTCIVETRAFNSSLFTCPLPANGCGASVELLSACVNEIAAVDPISLCTGTEGCGAASAVEAMLPTPPKFVSLPPTPACARLTQECPTVYFTYPCGD